MLNYIEHLLILAFVVTGCVSSSAFVSIAGFPIGITSFAGILKTYAVTGGIKKCNAMIKKKKKKHNKIVLSAKTKLNNIEVLISKALIDSYFSHDEFILVHVLKEYDDTKEEIKHLRLQQFFKNFNLFNLF